jgi:prepilin-type processing-associated H-X9-DG protein
MMKKAVVVGLALLVVLPSMALAAGSEFPLADRIPSGAMVYMGWAGQNKDYDASAMGKMLADPAAADIVSQVVALIQPHIPQSGQPMLQAGLDLSGALYRHPFAIALLDLGPDKRPRTTAPSSMPTVDFVVAGVIIADLGKDKDSFDKALSVFTSMIPPQIKVEDRGFTTLAGLPIKVSYGYIDNLFVLAVGRGTLDAVSSLTFEKSLAGDKRFTGPMAQVAADVAKGKVVAKGAQSAMYVDCSRLSSAIAALVERDGNENEVLAGLRKTFKVMGVEGVTAVASSSRVVDGSLYSRMRVFTPAPHRGAIGLLVAGQITQADLASLPSGGAGLAIGKLSPADVLAFIKTTVHNMADDGGKGFDDGLASFAKETGVSLQDDLFASLGDTWCSNGEISQEKGTANVQLSVTVKDPAKLSAAIDKLVASANKKATTHPTTGDANSDLGGKFVTTTVDGLQVYTLELPKAAMADPNVPPAFRGIKPSFCVTKGKLYAALTPEALLAATKGAPSISSDKDFVLVSSHVRTVGSTWFAYSGAGASPLGWMFTRPGQMPPDVEPILDSVVKLTKYFGPQAEAVWADKDGLVTESFGTLPGGRVSTVPEVALAVAVMLPALAHTQQLARRSASMANLHSFGLAMLTYENENKSNMPPNLDALVKANYVDAKTFVSPVNGTQYVYIGRGNVDDLEHPSLVIVAYEDPDAYKGKGTNALFADGHAEWLPIDKFNELLTKSKQALKGK